jgi:hypothetical protein
MSSMMDPRPTTRHRVEYHVRDTVRCLGHLWDVPPHHVTLDPFVSQLLLRGAEGQLQLIDEATGAVVARRTVRPFTSKARDRFRAH